MQTTTAPSTIAPAPTMSAPWAAEPAVPRPSSSDPVANWLVHESIRKNIRLRISEREITLDDVVVAAADITNVAFWTVKPTHHEFVLVSPATKVTFCVRDDRSDLTPSTHDFVALVRFLESAVLPRLVQHRLQRIDMGMTVAIDGLSANRAGLAWSSKLRSREMTWEDFDHVTVHRDHVDIISRKGKRLVPFAEVPLTSLDAVLIPLLLPAATSVFR